MKPIELQIKWLTADQVRLTELNLDFEADEANTKPVMFYSIDTAYPYVDKEGDDELCVIWSSGQNYIVDDTYANVKLMINEAL